MQEYPYDGAFYDDNDSYVHSQNAASGQELQKVSSVAGSYIIQQIHLDDRIDGNLRTSNERFLRISYFLKYKLLLLIISAKFHCSQKSSCGTKG